MGAGPGLSLGLIGAGTGLTLAGQIASADFNADIMKQNERFAKQEKKITLQRGEEAALRVKTMGEAVKATQKAVIAGQGLVVDVGTAVDARVQADRAIDQEMTTIRANAAMQAWGYDIERAESRLQRGVLRQRTLMGGLSTLIGGGLRVAQTLRKK